MKRKWWPKGWEQNDGLGFVLVFEDITGMKLEWNRGRDRRRGRTIYRTERAACDAARNLRHQKIMHKFMGWDVLPVLRKGTVRKASQGVIDAVAKYRGQTRVLEVMGGSGEKMKVAEAAAVLMAGALIQATDQATLSFAELNKAMADLDRQRQTMVLDLSGGKKQP